MCFYLGSSSSSCPCLPAKKGTQKMKHFREIGSLSDEILAQFGGERAARKKANNKCYRISSTKMDRNCSSILALRFINSGHFLWSFRQDSKKTWGIPILWKLPWHFSNKFDIFITLVMITFWKLGALHVELQSNLHNWEPHLLLGAPLKK